MEILFFKKYSLHIVVFLLLLDIVLGIAFWQYFFIKRPRIIFLNVGEGDAIFLDLGKNNQILVDGGSGQNVLDELGKHMPFYDRKIELVVLTHPDGDHLGGLVEVLKYYKVGGILETGISCETAVCNKWQDLIGQKNIPVNYAHFGQNIKAGSAVITVLYPFGDLKDAKVKEDNDTSVVLKVAYGDNSYLLTGDAGFAPEDELLSKNIDIESKILKVSHHGSKNASSDEFLRKARPEKAVISVGKNKYGHPAEELLDRLKNMNSEILRTDEKGDVIMY